MHSCFLSNLSRNVTLLATMIILGSLTLSTNGKVAFSDRGVSPSEISLRIQLQKISADGRVEILGEFRNLSKRQVQVEEPDSGNISITAIEEGWDADQEGWDGWFSLIPVGSFNGPDYTRLMPAKTITIPFEYTFYPGKYRIMWRYRPRAHDDTSFNGAVVSNELHIDVPDPEDDRKAVSWTGTVLF